MKAPTHFFIGLLALSNVVYKVIYCTFCDVGFLGLNIPGPVYLAIWTILTLILFYGAHKQYQIDKAIQNKNL